MNWYVSTDGVAWQTCAAAGIEKPKLTLRVNGLDEFEWRMPGDFLADAAYAAGATIYLASGAPTGPGGALQYTIRFIGQITGIPRQGAVAAEFIEFTASGGWWWLEQVTYAQVWNVRDTALNSLVNANILRVVLGQADDLSYLDSGAQIAAAINYAVTVGAPIAMGVVDTLATLPISEHICLRCADVIRQLLRFQPDVCCWFDYASGVPTFNCRKPANLATANIPLLATAVTSVSMRPRYDLQMPGVRIMYEQTNMLNGAASRSITYDIAPTPLPADPRNVGLYFELAGTSQTTKTQVLSVAAYPADTADKTFWRKILPWLDADNIADADLTIAGVSRSSVVINGNQFNLANYVVEGQITPWMNDLCSIQSGDELWQAKVSYIRKEGADVQEQVKAKLVTVHLLSTNAVSKKYTATVGYSAGEPIPAGLAAALYASWSRLHWDGTFTMEEQEATFACRPGMLCNLTGGRAEWAVMAALVQDAVIDLEKGETRIRTGTCGRLEADSLVALVRASHFWKYSYNFQARTNADSSENGNTIEGGSQLGRQVSDSADPGQAMVKRWSGTDADENEHEVIIDPSTVAFAVPADKASKTLQPTEILVPVKNANGGIDGKPVQAIACAPYGTAGSGGSVQTIIPSTASAAATNALVVQADKSWAWGLGLPSTTGITAGYALVVQGDGTIAWSAVSGYAGTASCVFGWDGSGTPKSIPIILIN